MSNHITGKVYDLTQENMQKLVAELETAQSKIKSLEDSILLLDALEQVGVDNWDGYADAKALVREWRTK